jgi:TonB family protein
MNVFTAVLLVVSALLLGQEPKPQVSAPHVVSKSEPVYNEEARLARVNATVSLTLVVRPDGIPDRVRVLRPAGFGLDEAAVECVKTWRFAPGMKDGEAVPVQAMVDVNFRVTTKENQGQKVRLTFTLPPGAGRPELMKGTIPSNPPPSDPDKRFRIKLTVNPKGRVENAAVIDASDPEWAEQALRQLEKWRFIPASVNGEGVAVDGVFELATGDFRYLH